MVWNSTQKITKKMAKGGRKVMAIRHAKEELHNRQTNHVGLYNKRPPPFSRFFTLNIDVISKPAPTRTMTALFVKQRSQKRQSDISVGFKNNRP